MLLLFKSGSLMPAGRPLWSFEEADHKAGGGQSHRRIHSSLTLSEGTWSERSLSFPVPGDVGQSLWPVEGEGSEEGGSNSGGRGAGVARLLSEAAAPRVAPTGAAHSSSR